MSFENYIDQIKEKDWFSGSGTDEFGRKVIYVKEMNFSLLSEIPSYINGEQILCHYDVSKNLSSEKYINDVTNYNYSVVEFEAVSGKTNDKYSELYIELDGLIAESNKNILEDILYEIHDGESNAITNLSAMFPKIRKSLENLYNYFSFEKIHQYLSK